MPPIIELLRNSLGFSGSYLVLGAILWNAIICGMLLKETETGVTNERNFKENRNIDKREEESFGENGKTPILLSFLDISPIRKHPNFVYFVILDTLLYHNFVVWAIFLVSFGKSVGLKPEEAVLLSTAGGVGGCIGKITVVATFYIDRMNALTSSLIPAIICNVGLLGYICSNDEYLLLMCSSLCGFSFAFTESALSGMVPRYVCRFHFRRGSTIFYVTDGIFTQLGCIIAGR
ncbi:Monocarboxylate transporter 2 [Holothuria leucospilota]|uniref:Monocarboxylate transporter 2 n=1 Tax=Holothuria leucospilota TaxID=206669 RepID=A0A9Q0YJ39_HOLLE|nr:Monocarboxylate transporter 2 [Holothuria leucospilota]